MVQDNFRFTEQDKAKVNRILFEEKIIPDFGGKKPCKTGRQDGVKYYFDDGSFVICRFSGTEPLLRIFAEAETEEKAAALIQSVKNAVL